MYCHRCGEHLPDDFLFCPKCGTKLETANNHTEAEKQSNTDDKSTGQEEAKADSNNQDNNEHHEQTSSHEADAPSTDSTSTEVATADPESVVTQEENVELQTGSIWDDSMSETRSNKKTKSVSFWISLALPTLSLVIFSITIIYYFNNESTINEQVLALQISGEEAALDGDLEGAKEAFLNALELRPGYAILNENLEEVEQALAFQKNLDDISIKLEAEAFDEAEELLSDFSNELNRYQGIWLDDYREQVREIQILITKGKIKNALVEDVEISTLAEKLNTLATLPPSETEELKEEIIGLVVEISYEQASDSLENYHFSKARSTVTRGLEIAVNNEKLMDLKTEIEQRQSEFSQAERQRLEEAEEAAAREDLRNRTEAVNIDLFETEMTDDGELYMFGEITNQATRTIYSVTIYYTVHEEDNYITEGQTVVTPHYLSPEENGVFEDTIPLSEEYEELTVRIESITWELD